MELRDIEMFLTLAEELHFGRTAARLHVSQARVSQAISRQERRLGAQLFDRANRRQIHLTPFGRQLRDDLQPVYAGLRDTLERARLAAQGITAVLRVGMLPVNAHDFRPYWETFRSRHPQWKLRIRHAPFIDSFAGLRRGDVDVLVSWLPVEEPDITVGPVLIAEPRILAVAAGHELTRRASVTLEMVSDYRLPTAGIAPEYWFDAYIPPYSPGGRRIERSLLVANNEEVLALISTGEIVTPYPIHMIRYSPRPDIAYLPIRDIAPLAYAAVWRSESENDLIRALARTIRDLGPLTPAE
ncbi:LysR substrate-binding domain-containing protein [Dactylosporangium sp. McL0621]|uniref:LysR substrate-binding domain-containing protein n=1 Tax=Dactylosporangium sp. McL0621 TaxID=3415678 RepID=UPI003CFB5BFF